MLEGLILKLLLHINMAQNSSIEARHLLDTFPVPRISAAALAQVVHQHQICTTTAMLVLIPNAATTF